MLLPGVPKLLASSRNVKVSNEGQAEARITADAVAE